MAQSVLLAAEIPSWGALMLALAAGLVAGGVVLVLGHCLQCSLLRGPARNWGELGELACAPAGGGLDQMDEAVYEPPVQRNVEVPDPFVHGAKLERREALRRTGNPVPVLVSDAAIQSDPVVGYVVNRSTGGLALLFNQRVEPGMVLSIRTKSAPETVPWVRLEVRNCRQAGRDWELGCRFQRTPPWSVLLMFG